MSTTIEQYFIIEDNFSNRKIKWYFKNHIMKFIKIVWSLHCLRLLDPDYNYFLAAKNISSQQFVTRLLPSPGGESSQGDDQRVPQPLVLAALQPPDDPPEPAVLGGGEDQDPRV